ncbi:hypothetical protein, partial [Shouchella clausii]|uniref:hypothetical protein n=1 Tax=Shouchella clausii TaxID=79880 RepID=UPI00280BB624
LLFFPRYKAYRLFIESIGLVFYLVGIDYRSTSVNQFAAPFRPKTLCAVDQYTNPSHVAKKYRSNGKHICITAVFYPLTAPPNTVAPC